MERDYRLNKGQKDNLRTRQQTDLLNVLDVYCLDKGCVHSRTRPCSYLAHGKIGKPIDMDASCSNACPICNGEWSKSFLPILIAGMFHLFKDVEDMPCLGTYDNLLDLIWKKEHWIEQMFDKNMSSVTKGQLEGLFLQLIANRLIGLVKRNGALTWNVLREQNSELMYPPHSYANSSNWTGIHLMPCSKANIE